MTSEIHQKMISAYQLLSDETLSIATFERVRTLLTGLHPDLDQRLASCSRALDTLQKLGSGDLVSLSAEHLGEDTPQKKKRKKALLFFLSSLKNLKSEIKRVDAELAHTQQGRNSLQTQASAWGRIIGYAKGPVGIITLLAVVAVGWQVLHKSPKAPPATTTTRVTIQVITYQDKQLPLGQLYIGHGSDCDSPHYHATTGTVLATDGTRVADPEGCGFGKVSQVQVVTLTVTPTP